MNSLDVDYVVDNRFRLLRRIGQGMFSTVWQAEDVETGTPVALKVAPTGSKFHVLEAFEREIRALGRLQDIPGVVRMLGSGSPASISGTVPSYVALEWLGGYESVSVVQLLPLGEAQALAEALLGTLAEVHTRRLAHGDLKGDSVLWNGIQLKIIDWNIARFLDDSSDYDMSLMIQGDLIAAGEILYRVFVGRELRREPMPGGTTLEGLPWPIDFVPGRSTPDGLQQIIRRLVHIDLRERYKSAASALRDLRNVEFSRTSDDRLPAERLELEDYSVLSYERQRLLSAAQSCFMIGDYQQASQLLRKVLELAPGDPVAENYLRQILLQMSRSEWGRERLWRIEDLLVAKGSVGLEDFDEIPDAEKRYTYQQYAQTRYEQPVSYDSQTGRLLLSKPPDLECFLDACEQMAQAAMNHRGEQFQKSAEIIADLFSKRLSIPYSPCQVEKGFYCVVFETQQLFQGLIFPTQLPMTFYSIQRSSDVDFEGVRAFLIRQRAALGSVVLLVVPVKDALFLEQVRAYITDKVGTPYACDIAVWGFRELRSVFLARDPLPALRRQVLQVVDLLNISPFAVTGATPDSVFFGREPELRQIVEHVDKSSFAVIGGRRIGKTSLLARLHRVRLPAAGYRTLYLDCSNIASYDAFLAAPIRDWRPEAPPNAPAILGRLLSPDRNTAHKSKISERLQLLWKKVFATLRSLFGRATTPDLSQKNTADDRSVHPITDDRPLVLLLDETDRLVQADGKGEWQLFNTLRALANTGRAQVVLSGERVLRSAIRDATSPLFNFANEIVLAPLDFRAVEELVTQPMRQMAVELVNETAIVRRVFDFTSGHPNIVQRLCFRLVERMNELESRRITLDDVNAVIENPRFQETDFLQTYWEAASLLEKILTLVLARDPRTYRLREVQQRLSEQAHIKSSMVETKDALDRLVDLRSILKRSQHGYSFAVKAFPLVLANTTTVEDLLEVMVEDYTAAQEHP